MDADTNHLILARRGGFFDEATHTLRAEGFDASEDGTGRGTPLVPCAIQAGALRENPASGPDGVGVRSDGVAYTLEARAEVQAVAFNWNAQVDQMKFDPNITAPLTCSQEAAVAFQSSQSGVRVSDLHATLDSNNGPRRHNGALVNMAVRRLTPMECERLQGFPDHHTNIPIGPKRRPAADGPRYKALGNSMAVPCMRWIGRRIKMVAAKYPLEVDFL